MTTEDRLRSAIEARTSSVEPADDGLERITQKLLDQGEQRPMHVIRNPWLLAAAAAVLVVTLVGGFVAVSGDDPDEIGTTQTDTSDTPTTDEPATSTTAPPSTSTTASSTPPSTAASTPGTTAATAPSSPAVPADVLEQAAWPRPSSEVRFEDPVAAANSFARYYVRFTDPVVGAFRAGDNRSGEVPVQPFADGPETTVLVRQLSDDRWYVIAAVTDDIAVDQPAAGATLTCPQPVGGRALAYEGTVDVSIDAYQPDGDRVTVGEGFVTGSGSPPAGPFTDQIACTIPSGVEPSGLMMFRDVDQSGDGTGTLRATVLVVDLS